VRRVGAAQEVADDVIFLGAAFGFDVAERRGRER
jgi:hypothetical protein